MTIKSALTKQSIPNYTSVNTDNAYNGVSILFPLTVFIA